MPELPRLFSALSDNTRFNIVERLMNEGELPAGEIRQAFNISAPAISRHLAVLYQAGLVSRRVDRQQRIYAVRREAIEAISTWTIDHQTFWRQSLNRLEAALKKEL